MTHQALFFVLSSAYIGLTQNVGFWYAIHRVSTLANHYHKLPSFAVVVAVVLVVVVVVLAVIRLLRIYYILVTSIVFL